MSSRKSGFGADLHTAFCGFCMGSVDVIPGVSGGTMALILGIYERLVTAISRVDMTFWGHVKAGNFGDAARHIDLRFLLVLGLGIGVAVLTLAGVMKTLLEDHRTPTFGLFFGLILASGALVGRMIRRWSAASIVLLPVGAVFAYWLTRPESGGTILPFGPEQVGEHGYAFICGAIAICAMILPGISGSYLLLLLGMYDWVLGCIRSLRRFDISTEQLIIFIVFACGALLGLLMFSKLLRWLLAKYHDPTLALLCGFMLGSLRKLWPFKTITDANRWPNDSAELWLPAVLAVVGVAAVFALTMFASSLASTSHARK